MENEKKFVVLEGIKDRNRFYSTNVPGSDPTKGGNGEEWYRVIGYADTSDEARKIIRGTTFEFKLWDGANNRTRDIVSESYVDACWQAGVEGFPPSYIWSIEPK